MTGGRPEPRASGVRRASNSRLLAVRRCQHQGGKKIIPERTAQTP